MTISEKYYQLEREAKEKGFDMERALEIDMLSRLINEGFGSEEYE